MIPFEKFGDDFIDAVSSKLDLKGMSASPPDDDDLLGKGEIPKDAEEKLGGGQETLRAPDTACVLAGAFCSYDCAALYRPPYTPVTCIQGQQFNHGCTVQNPFECDIFSCKGSDFTCASDVFAGGGCDAAFTHYDLTCSSAHECGNPRTEGDTFACGRTVADTAFACDNGFGCHGDEWFSCFDAFTCTTVQCGGHGTFYCSQTYEPNCPAGHSCEVWFKCNESSGDYDGGSGPCKMTFLCAGAFT